MKKHHAELHSSQASSVKAAGQGSLAEGKGQAVSRLSSVELHDLLENVFGS